MEEKNKIDNNYGESQIQVLEGLDPVKFIFYLPKL